MYMNNEITEFNEGLANELSQGGVVGEEQIHLSRFGQHNHHTTLQVPPLVDL